MSFRGYAHLQFRYSEIIQNIGLGFWSFTSSPLETGSIVCLMSVSSERGLQLNHPRENILSSHADPKSSEYIVIHSNAYTHTYTPLTRNVTVNLTEYQFTSEFAFPQTR